MPTRTTLLAALVSTASLLGCGTVVIIEPGADDDDDTVEPLPDVPGPPLGDCTMALSTEYSFGLSLEIAGDGLTASCLNDSYGVAHGNASHVGGRWYFEVSIDSMSDEGIWWAQNLGVGTAEVLYNTGVTGGMGAFLNTTGSLADPFSTPNFSGAPYGPGDVVGVAADLDAGRVFFRKNGGWMNGANPAAGNGGVEIMVLPGSGSYYPAIGLSTGDVATFNFGATDFAYPPPEGFAPFGSGIETDASGACIDPGPEGIPATPAPMEAICATGDFTSYASGASGAEELHIVGIYTPGGGEGGQVDVHVERQGATALVLSTYDAAKFRVTTAPGATVTRILLSSYAPSTVTAPPGVPVDSYVYEVNGQALGFASRWPNDTGGGDTQELVAAAESETGLPMSSFSGCYGGDVFTLTD
ncbi:SPRY domain-containing protein [Chondromyces apiculatus]|uniref:B30.2/SPRY domain-containing protein n=1 Tax=Chondromyces apiculatus DSM 436 TaxID=1192034 RepID=A0A017T764_9BACT|nr:SPRY domain-containing protein [Chondromyces apiculatus]EYF05044.1 Hypothetical protein CAP_3634 [Chondromyces apiculatus DSM 436]